MSARWSTRCESSACSGAMKSMVPMYMPLWVSRPAAVLLNGLAGVDDPGQSQVEHADRPARVEHQVAGLMSRWTIPWAWAASRPRAAWIRQSMAWRTGSGPRLADDAVEVASLDVVHDQEMDAAVFVGVEGGDEVGVLEPAGGLDLAPKPHDGIAGRERTTGAGS